MKEGVHMADKDLDTPAESGTASLTRRQLMQGAACAIAISGLPIPGLAQEEPRKPAAAAPADHTVITKLSTYMAEAGGRELSAEGAEATKHHILDSIAAMVSGSELAAAQVAVRFARAYGGEKVATVVGSDVVCGPIEAAMVNAMQAHSDETDDSHAPSRCHPGCSIVPAALASGEKFGVDGNKFLRAVALGYDIGCRFTMTLGNDYIMLKNHFDTHQIATNFGCHAAAGCCAGFTPQQMRWMIDYASQQAAGINAWRRDSQHIHKSLCFGGYGARNGVTAALLMSAGATGVDDILSGEDNYFLSYAPKANPADLLDKLGERYEVARTNIKKWTVGSPIQSPLDCLYNLFQKRQFHADEVDKVVVRVGTSGAGITNNRDMPDICMQHMVAVMLVDKTASFKAAHDVARMKDPDVLRQRAKITVIPDAELEKLYPRRAGIVELTFKDGTTLTDRVDDTRGTLENPMTRAEVVTKCQDLMAEYLGADQSKRLIEAILKCESIKDIRSLRPLLQRS